ncbi:MAG: ATP-dependent RNA helicase, partial [Ancrocorticia sp.]|uniref:ATP-dependent RNA helicase n=1 Tax=Ancrocorticia sp. TaxID=2593684 RepID=UPI003F8FB46A
DLPVSARIGDVRAALAGGAVVIQSPPGTGKTTIIPQVVAEECEGRVIVTQPRRVAARAAARRIANLRGERVGESVGFSVRGESKLGPATRIEMVTPGVLVRRLQRDPELNGVGAVILDEVHERHLDTDLAMAMCVDVREALRDDLLLVAMSATVEAARTAALIGGTIVDVPGKIYPLHTVWAPPPRGKEALGSFGGGSGGGVRSGPSGGTGRRAGSVSSRAGAGAIGVRHEFLDWVADTVDRALTEIPDGDVLVFLPGVREVREVAGLIRGGGAEVLELHGSLSSAEQDRIFQQGPLRRVIVSTAIAESSLTVPGVRIVVDAGLSREPRMDYGHGMGGLVTVRESQAAGTQRAGRAGRLGPGYVYRTMDQTTWARLVPQSEPEIRTADLTDFMLEAAVWGSPDAAGLALLDEPLPAGKDAAQAVLQGIGAVDGDGRATPLGKRLAELPVSPRVGRALLESAPEMGAGKAAKICAILEEDVRIADADLAGAWPRVTRGSASWKLQSKRLEKLARTTRHSQETTISRPSEREISAVILRAFPDRVARKRRGTGRYLLANGVGAVLPDHSPLEGSEWLAIAHLDRGQGRADAMIRMAAPLDEDQVETLTAHNSTSRHEVTFTGGKLRGCTIRELGAIELSAADSPVDATAARTWLGDEIAAGKFSLQWTEPATKLRQRIGFLHRAIGAPWPDVSDEALGSRLEEWAGLEIERFIRGGKLGAVKREQLERIFPWPDAANIDSLAPERIVTPGGQSFAVDYSGERPTIRLRVQQAFGWTKTPEIAGVQLTLELLSPASRPVAITDDLAGFWNGAYAQVRAEMRGRYPRHPWPEEPAHEAPTNRAKRRG